MYVPILITWQTHVELDKDRQEWACKHTYLQQSLFTGLKYWTGLLDSPLTLQMVYLASHILCQFNLQVCDINNAILVSL